jgi:hypothetical protein
MLKEAIYKGLRDFESVTTKVVRLPAVFVDRLLVLAHYMDDNEGELPFISPVVFVRHGVPDSPRQD